MFNRLNKTVMKQLFLFFLVLTISFNVYCQIIIPKVYTNITVDSRGDFKFDNDGRGILGYKASTEFSISNFIGGIRGTESGFDFDFKLPAFNGTLYYGFIPFGEQKYPVPVYFKSSVPINGGKASVNVRQAMIGLFDIISWGINKKGVLGYRIADQNGKLIYEGKVAFRGTGPFEIMPTIIEGPIVGNVTSEGCVISFTTSTPIQATITVDYWINDLKKTKDFSDAAPTTRHEIEIKGFNPSTTYIYRLTLGGIQQEFSFSTNAKSGSKQAFTFAFAANSRNSQGGGERNVYGSNFSAIRKTMALAAYKKAAFVQFAGDMVSGYCLTKEEMELQYANWKRAVEPYTHYMPVYTAMGNHELMMMMFPDDELGRRYMIDKFPFNRESSEAVFAANFINPANGPVSEDGALYDPDNKSNDFPPYSENVYYYTCDNVAMVVLNTNYWFSPSVSQNVLTSGNPYGYVMDNQMSWLRTTINKLEGDKNIDHIFVVLHAPVFPNGGHVEDGMWYLGNNRVRAVVAGNAMKTGIIQRRDELLELLVNTSKKTVALLCGDDHNYNRLEIISGMKMYSDDYQEIKINLSRNIWQINNGGGGATLYAKEETPWMENIKCFQSQNAVVFFHINGASVKLEVINPETLEIIEEQVLK